MLDPVELSWEHESERRGDTMGFLVAILAYLGGSIPVGLLVSRLVKGIDIRKHGSGNIGAANVLRTIGPAGAAIVFILDATKGYVPILLGRQLGLDPLTLAGIGLAAVLGHNFSVFLKFHGGKGVATSFGIALALAPLAAIVALAVWLLAVLVTGYASVGSMLALAAIGPAVYAFGAGPAAAGLGAVLFALTVYQHRGNVKRLAQGKELRLLRKTAPPGGRG